MAEPRPLPIASHRSIAPQSPQAPAPSNTVAPAAPAPSQRPDAATAGHDSYAVFDRVMRAQIANITGGLSPNAIATTILDWAGHLARAPGKQMHLAERAMIDAARLWRYSAEAAASLLGAPTPAPLYAPHPGDRRFTDPAWAQFPYSVLAQNHLAAEAFFEDAASDVRGMSARSAQRAQFLSGLALKAIAPSNFPALNPVVAQATLASGGLNFVRGAQHLFEDNLASLNPEAARPRHAFKLGRDLAATPGKIVFRNHLMELIQYAPATQNVRTEPVLIIPAWIMKFYILDLTPAESLVRFLTERGHTVFMISWRNPNAEDRDLGLEDYRRLGVMASLDAVRTITQSPRVHACGYCLGGTLLSIAAAAMARDGDDRLGSITLLAAQTDFTEAGELLLFVDESQLSLLEDAMWAKGTLETAQMAGAFQLLRSDDLVFSKAIRTYGLGQRDAITPLMAWNGDGTRMPYRMQTEYLRGLFLENRLSAGRFAVDGRIASLTDITAPIFAVGAQKDHIAPWRSVYKITLISRTAVTFALVSGGHNAGIVAPPVTSTQNKPARRFQIMTRAPGDHYLDPQSWARAAPMREGSWWHAWADWLAAHSSPATINPPPFGAPQSGLPILGDAPGPYVLQR
jgi:polyhydroxyalkanoate synthase subunit PhaC